MPFSRRVRRIVSRAAAVMLLTSMVTAGVAVHAPKALAAGTVLFNQPFHDNTVDGTAGSVSLPTAPAVSGNTAYLTAAGNATANPLASCPTVTDLQGSGKLRLTANVGLRRAGSSPAPASRPRRAWTWPSTPTSTGAPRCGWAGLRADPAQYRRPAGRQRYQRHRQHHRHLESHHHGDRPPTAIAGAYTATITHSVS